MAEQRLRLERREDVERVHVRVDRLLRDADLEVAVLAHDVRVVLALPEDVQPAVRARAPEDVRAGVDAAPLRAADEPRELVLRHPSVPAFGGGANRAFAPLDLAAVGASARAII